MNNKKFKTEYNKMLKRVTREKLQKKIEAMLDDITQAIVVDIDYGQAEGRDGFEYEETFNEVDIYYDESDYGYNQNLKFKYNEIGSDYAFNINIWEQLTAQEKVISTLWLNKLLNFDYKLEPFVHKIDYKQKNSLSCVKDHKIGDFVLKINPDVLMNEKHSTVLIKMNEFVTKKYLKTWLEFYLKGYDMPSDISIEEMASFIEDKKEPEKFNEFKLNQYKDFDGNKWTQEQKENFANYWARDYKKAEYRNFFFVVRRMTAVEKNMVEIGLLQDDIWYYEAREVVADFKKSQNFYKSVFSKERIVKANKERKKLIVKMQNKHEQEREKLFKIKLENKLYNEEEIMK